MPKPAFTALAVILLAPATLLHAQDRAVTFNGRTLNSQEWRTLRAVEQAIQFRFPDGAYWYDNRSGAVGTWGGPTGGFLRAGLALGGRMPSDCSSGGTYVFVNGRELHPNDVASLSRLGPVFRGRYWVDGNGDYGFENGPRTGNLVALAYARSSAPRPQRRVYGPGELSGVFGNSAGYCTNSGCVYLGR